VGANAEAAGFWRMAARLVDADDPRRDVYLANAASVLDPVSVLDPAKGVGEAL
jgi:hypothetical protein